MSIEADIIEEAKKVETAVEEVKAEVKSEVKKLVIELTDSEKVAMRDLEIMYFRSAQDASLVAQRMEQAKIKYQELLKAATEKYLNDAEKAASYVWDEVTASFTLLKESK